MYQLIPLILALALLIPWTGPADPGGRIAAANAADGLAEQALILHQTAIAYVAAHPGANGLIDSGALPAGWSAQTIVSCAAARAVATYVAVPPQLSKPAVAAALARLWGGFPLVGLARTDTVTNPYTGSQLALPCPIPDQSPVICSQAGG
jgi:hypothetical protein